MQNITPYLWFNDNAEEAVEFYLSVFRDSRKGEVLRYGENAPFAAGTVMTATFYLNGLQFVALNGGPHYTITPGISFLIQCETQEEVDHYWENLSEGGEEMPCGWLTDRFGVTWQVVPSILFSLLRHQDSDKAKKVLSSMLKMKKLIIADLRSAADL